MPTVNELRGQYPDLAGLDDEGVVSAVQRAFYPDLPREAIAERLGVKPAEPKPEPASLARRVVGDSAISLLKGAIAVPEAGVGLLDLATGGAAGKAAEAVGFKPDEARRVLDEYYSPQQKEANKAVQQAQGVGDTITAALANPSTIIQAAIESAPSLLPAGAISRGALALAPRIGGAVAAGIGEGAISAGQTAEQVRQETPDGRLTAEQSGIAGLSGALTGVLGVVAGKVANRLGIGDVNQLVAGVKNAGPEAKKGVVRSLMEGFATEGVLQELPQSAQEQVAQNIALGKPWDEGVGNAAVMGALAGGAMGAAAGPMGHGAAAPSVADQLRAEKLPENGAFTRAINAGIDAHAASLESDAAAVARVAQTARQRAAEISAPTFETAPGATPPASEGSIEFEPSNVIDTGRLELGDRDGNALQNVAAMSQRLPPMDLENAQRILNEATAQGHDFAIVRRPDDGFIVMPRNLVTQQQIDEAQAQPVQVPAAGGLSLEGDTNPAAQVPAVPALGYDTSPTGRLIAGEDGSVRPETRAEAVNREQATRQRTELGLTPDVERASMRAAMGTQSEPGDILTANGFPFRNRRAAQAAAVRAGEGFAPVEIAPDTFVVRKSADITTKEAAKPDVSTPEQVAQEAAPPAAAQGEEIRTPSGGPFKSKAPAERAARLNPGYALTEVDGGWVLRKEIDHGTVAGRTDEDGRAQRGASSAVDGVGGEPGAGSSAGTGDSASLRSGVEHSSGVHDDALKTYTGEPIDKQWTAFAPEAGSLNIPRADMPQIKAEHRGAMTNFLNARGIAHEQAEVPAGDLKPSQAEFSPERVQQAKDYQGGERSILVSSDNRILDGHHQWLAKLDANEPVKVIKLDAPLDKLIEEVRQFPSAETADGATPATESKPAADEVPALSRGEGQGSQAVDLREALGPVVTSWKAGPAGGVHVVQSLEDLPERVRDSLKAQDAEGNTRAIFVPGKQAVYLVADRLANVTEAQNALFHEVYGHMGLRSVLGTRYGEVMGRMRDANRKLAGEAVMWFLANGEAEIKARIDRGMQAGPARREVQLLAVEEALADRAGRNETVSSWRYLVAQIQKGLRAIGLDKVADWMENHTRAEVMDLLRQARNAVKLGPPGEVMQGTPAPALSRQEGPQKVDGGVLLSRSPSEAVSELAPQVVKDLIAGSRDFKKVSWWHKSVGTMFDMAQKHPAFKRVFDDAQAYIRDTSFFANDAADQAPRVLPQLNDFGDFKKALTLPEADRKAISAPIFEGTLEWTRDEAGKLVKTDDVDQAGVVFTPEELADRFKLNDRQIELYREFRAAIDRSLDSTLAGDVIRYMGEQAPDGARVLAQAGEFDAMRDAVMAHLNQLPAGKLRDEMGAEVLAKYERVDSLKARGYAPLMRFGKFAVRVIGAETGESKFFGLYESGADAAKAARLLAQDPQFKNDQITRGVMSQEDFKLLKGLSPETLGLFASITGTDKDEAMQVWLKQATANRSALKRMIHRKGIEGFSGDVTRVLSNFITSNARGASQGLHFGELQQHVNDIKEGDIKDAAVRLRDYVQNPMEEATALRGFLFANFLGGSLASAAVNMTQPFLMTMPYLSKFVGIPGAAKLMASSLKMMGGGDADMKRALNLAEQEGIVSPQELHQLQAMAMGRGSFLGQAARFLGANEKISGTLDTAGKRAMFIWGAPFALAEQFNRRLTFIAAYQVAKQKGHVDPFAFAANAVIETQGLYNKANRPEWARGAIGATLFTFKQYSIGYLEFMKRLWTSGAPGSIERTEGRKAALFGMALLVLAAGAQGLPGADDLDDLIDTIGQRMGHDTNSKRWKQQNLPTWLNYGFSALPGIPLDVAGRLGIGNLIPGTGLLRMDKTDKSADVWEIAGAAGGVAQNVLKAADSGSIAPMLPTAIANVMKGYDIASTGAYRDTKGRRVIDADAGDALTKAIGFQPSSVAAASRSDGLNIARTTLAKNTEASIVGDWASARFEGDRDGEDAARQRLRDWNETNPETPISISMSQIVRRVQQMKTSRAERVQKSAPKELRAQMAQAG